MTTEPAWQNHVMKERRSDFDSSHQGIDCNPSLVASAISSACSVSAFTSLHAGRWQPDITGEGAEAEESNMKNFRNIIFVGIISLVLFSFSGIFQDEWVVPDKYQNMKNPTDPEEDLKIGKSLCD